MSRFNNPRPIAVGRKGGNGMKIRDKTIKELVDVSEKDCLNRTCYWPRPDPGVFTQGVGYRTRNPGRKPEWLCGHREIHGCPKNTESEESP